jgi:hypothetical protein
MMISFFILFSAIINGPLIYIPISKLRLVKYGKMALAQVKFAGAPFGVTFQHSKIAYQTAAGEVIARIPPREFKTGDTIRVVYDPDLPTDVTLFDTWYEVISQP